MWEKSLPEALYLDDMNLKEFKAKVLTVTEGKFIILDRTAFYPKSGGVANDEGLLLKDSDSYKVVYVGKFGGKISHEVDKVGLKVGDIVTGRVDWKRRSLLMRYHTAVHVISGAFFRNLGAKITGGDISMDQGRVDFNLEKFDREEIEAQIEECNKIIQKNYPVKVYYMNREEVEADPDLTKLAKGLPKNIKTVRIVDIEGFDRQPDGGCHIGSLKEIGKVEITKLINKGKNNRRLYFILQ